MNIAAWTASTSFSLRATVAEIHENANPIASTRSTVPTAPGRPFSNRNPTR